MIIFFLENLEELLLFFTVEKIGWLKIVITIGLYVADTELNIFFGTLALI